MMILLPEKIRILLSREGASIPVDAEGFSLYFDNYSPRLSEHQSNRVHPNLAGYRQMDDALASVVEKLRNE